MDLPSVKVFFSSNRSRKGHPTCRRNVPGPLVGAGPMRLFVCLCMALTLGSFLFPARASAHIRLANSTPTGGPTLQVTVGFEDDSRLDYWTPAWITLNNDGPDFTGVISATTYTSPLRSGLVVGAILPWSYKEPVTLPHGKQKQIALYVPFYENPGVPRGIIATLSDSHGKVIATQTDAPFSLGTPQNPGSLLIGILSDQTAEGAGVAPLNAVSLPDPNRRIELATLDASTLPDISEVLGNFDVIVLDDFDTNKLSAAQLTALQTWVNQGGVLIEIGGPQWQRTLAPLPPQLLPVIMHGTAALPAGTPLLPTGSPTIAETGQQPAPDSLQKPITISTAALPEKSDPRQQALSNLETVLASGTTPLIVQAHQGQGDICYIAFDPTTSPLIDWPGAIALWQGLLLRTLGDQSLIPDTVFRYNNGPGQVISRGGLLQILQPNTFLPVWALVFLLLGYIVFIGPIRFLIVKRLKRHDRNWRIILSSVVVFSLFTYGFAYSQKREVINSISIIQIDQGGNSAHVTTFLSTFIPGQGNFQVHIPARTLAQPITTVLFQSDISVSDSSEQTDITIGQHETTINLKNSGPWTLHPMVTEGDQELHGGLISHLALRSGNLQGTVTNALGTSLSDVYILMPYSFAYIGHLAAGQTQRVSIPLHRSTSNAGTTLADQIASYNHQPVPYFPYASGSQPQNIFQRHLAILSALSGEGYSFIPCDGLCSTHAIVGKHVILAPPPGAPNVNPVDGSDPLLAAGAPATLIGWADQPVDQTNDVTINGASPAGTHDNLIQVPLNIDFSGSLNLPPGIISGQVIDAQGDQVQITSPNVYTMNTGRITFEFILPNTGDFQINSMTITDPVIAQSAGSAGPGHLQIRLYNWDKNTWDSITLNNYTFTTTNTKGYTNSDGRILLQVVNQDASLGAISFGKPSLSLNNAVS